jgi:zinc protease
MGHLAKQFIIMTLYHNGASLRRSLFVVEEEHLKQNPGGEMHRIPRSSGGYALNPERQFRLREIFVVSVLLMLLTALLPVRSARAAVKESVSHETVLRSTLENGLRVIIVRNTLAPVVTTEINYLVGSDEAPAGFPGTAHAMEHMMFRGSPGLSANQLADVTAAMGGDFDADTQQMVTQFFFTIPAEDLDVALHIESIRMRSVLCTDSLWDKERGAIEQEVASDLSNPEYVFYTKLLSAMFEGTPYAHDALGTRPSFNKTSGTMLHDFHNTWYAPNNAILIIVGDVVPEKALAEVKKLFGSIPSRSLPKRPDFVFNPVKTDTMRLQTDLPYGLAVISYRMPGTNSPDYAAAEILSDVLSSQRGSLYSLVPQGKALYAGFEYAPLTKSGLGFALAAFPKGYDSAKLMTEINDTLAEELRSGVPANLVDAAKRHEISEAEFQKNSISGLAQAWSDAVAIEHRNSPNDDLKMMEKVTVQDVNRVAREYLNPEHAIFAILTPQASGKPITSKGFGGAESFTPAHTTPVKLPAWANRAIRQPSVPRPTTNPSVTILPNGIKLIVQPESISNTVTVIGEVKNNPQLEQPRGQDGVSGVLDQLFSFGTTTLNRVEYQKALDDIRRHELLGSGTQVEFQEGRGTPS